MDRLSIKQVPLGNVGRKNRIQPEPLATGFITQSFHVFACQIHELVTVASNVEPAWSPFGRSVVRDVTSWCQHLHSIVAFGFEDVKISR